MKVEAMVQINKCIKLKPRIASRCIVDPAQLSKLERI